MDKSITFIKVAVTALSVAAMLGLIAIIVMIVLGSASGQTHTMPGSNVVPSGASLTIQSGGSITAAAGSTVTGFGGGGGSSTTGTGFWHNTAGVLDGASRAVDVSSADVTGTLAAARFPALTGDVTNTAGALATTIANSAVTNAKLANSTISIAGTSTALGGSITQDTITGLSSTGIVKRTAANTLAVAVAGTDYVASDSPLQWDGGSTNLVAATGRSSLGGTTVGQSFFTLANPGAITFPEISATNVVSTKTAAQLKTDLSLTATDVGLGSVTNNAQTQAAIVPNTAPSAGQILIGNAGGTAYAKNTVSGSGATITLSSAGLLTISAIPNASLSGAPVGAIVGTTDTQTLTNKRVNPRVTSIASNATWSPSADTDDVYEITAQTAAVTVISNPTGTPVDGQSLIIRFSDNGTARALTWSGTQWQAGPGLALPTSTIVGNHDYVGFKWNSTTSKWTMVASTQLNGTVDDTAYASSWNGVTGIGPSKNAVYDELHLIDTADNGTIVNAGTGFRIAGAAASGTILQGNGTNYVASTPTWPTGGATAAYEVRSDGTNYTAYPSTIINASTAAVTTSYAADTYLAGSALVVAAGDFKAKGEAHWVFDMVKTGAGVATPIITVRVGTAGTTADTTATITFTFGAGTGVVDTGIFEVWVVWRSVGSGTSAVIQGVCKGVHNLATTGLFNNAATWTIVGTASSGFNSSAVTTIGLSFNGGSSFSGTNTLVKSDLLE